MNCWRNKNDENCRVEATRKVKMNAGSCGKVI